MPRFLQKEKQFKVAEIDTILEFTRRVYLLKLKFTAPVCLIVNDKHVFRDVKELTAEELAAVNLTVLKDIEFETYILTAAVTKGLKFECTTIGDIAGSMHYIVDTKTRKREDKQAEATELSGVEAPAQKNSKSKSTGDNIAKEADIQRWINKQTELAEKIWEEVKNFDENDDFAVLNELDQLKFFQSRYSNFNKQHPLILRYMIQGMQFSTTAFKKYLVKLTNSKQNGDAFFERQADYVVLLWKDLTPKYNPKRAKELWETTFKTIKSESESFRELQSNADFVATKIEERLLNDFKSELADSLDKHGGIPEITTSKDERLYYMAYKISRGEESSEDERPLLLE